jgi:hypothetical protein
MSEYIRTSPYLFRPLKRTVALCIAVLVVGAIFVPAPLEIAADPGHPPNPARSAWFLLWIQELVSYSTAGVYVAIALAILLVAAPWLPTPRADRAEWFPRRLRPVTLGVVIATATVLILTIIAAWLRGPNWQLVPLF